MPPFERGSGSNAPFDLVYLFPGAAPPVAESLIRDSFSSTGLSRFFNSIRFIYAELDREMDHYVRENYLRPPSQFGLRSGPNSLFFHMMREAGPDYACLIQMETDCFPIRPGWLAGFARVEKSAPESWVIGSRYHGPKLPSQYRNHLNGNAIYRSGRADFQEFVSGFWEKRVEGVVKFQRPELAFDCAWEEYRNSWNGHPCRREIEEAIERYGDRFLNSPYIANMVGTLNYPATIPTIDQLTSDLPDTFIVHGSWLEPEIRQRTAYQPDESTFQGVEKSPAGQDNPAKNWIWIKGLDLSENAWFDGGHFVLSEFGSKISWRFGEKPVPLVQFDIGEGEALIIETYVVRPSTRILIRKLVQSIQDRQVPGTLWVLGLSAKLRGVDWDQFIGKALAGVRRCFPIRRFPVGDLFIGLIGGKVFAILR